MPGSSLQSAKPVRRAAVVTHGKPATIGAALKRLEGVAQTARVELVFPEDEVEKHGLAVSAGEFGGVDLVTVLGGDGTMLRALQRLLDTGIPAVGVNFGRVGFLASIQPEDLERSLARVLAGEYRVVELPTVDLELDGERRSAVNDIVVASSIIGRMIELSWSIKGEELGTEACDGIICATPQGSTAYNLSNGGPVLVWGLDALAVTFIAPHSLQARSMVVPPGFDVVVTNQTPDVPALVLYDGHPLGEIPPTGRATVRLGDRRARLAALPETTFFHRYRETFAS
jgi:NAD+ kinase